MSIYNVIVIGGGLAGNSATLFLSRSMLTHLTFVGEEDEQYGLLATTNLIENFPGFDGLEGKKLVKKIRKQAEKFGGMFVKKRIIKVDFSSRPFKVYDSDNIEYLSSSIIIATGSIPNRLYLENEAKLWGRYISNCAICDGPHFKNKKIVVIGGGNSSLQQGLFLSKFSKVVLIHRKNCFRASTILQKRVLNHPKIKVIFDNEIVKLNTEGDKLKSIICENIVTGEQSELPANAIFYALGFSPNSELFKGQLEIDEKGYIVIKKSEHFETMTSVEGVFVAGDVGQCRFKQAITSASSGCVASLDVINYLHELHIIPDDLF